MDDGRHINVKNRRFITMCKAHGGVSKQLKQQKINIITSRAVDIIRTAYYIRDP